MKTITVTAAMAAFAVATMCATHTHVRTAEKVSYLEGRFCIDQQTATRLADVYELPVRLRF